MTYQHEQPDNFEESENHDMTPDERLAALRRKKAEANIAEVQRRLNEPQRQRDARLVQRFGSTAVLDAEKRFPSLTGDEQTGSALADQFEAGMMLSHDLAEARFVSVGDTAKFMAVHVAGDRLGKFRAIADRAVADYFREFEAPAGRPTAHPTGFTVESQTSTGATPDTRTYAILARYPFERTPVASQAELNAFVTKESRHKMCDLRLNGGFCDGAAWSDSTLVPIARADVIVFVAVCGSCWKSYCERHEISGGTITDPDDTID